MAIPNLREDPLLERFFIKRDQKETTQDNYYYHLLNYYKATGLTLTEAIKEAENDEDNGLRLRDRRIEDRQLQYLKYLREKGASHESIRKGLSAIRTLYSHYDIQLPKPPIIRNETEDSSTTTLDLPGLEEIKKALGNAVPLYQAIIVLMASSGMGRSEILSLTIQNFIDSMEKYFEITLEDLKDIPSLRKKLPSMEEIGPLTWWIYRVKMKHTNRKKYLTFSTPESLDYILRYFDLTKRSIQSIDEKLFISRRGNPLTQSGFNSYFSLLNRRCGWDLKGHQAYFRSHNLRKWFANQLENTSLGYINTNRLMGHEPLNQTDARYFKVDPDQLYNLYYENMDIVSLFSKVEVHDKTEEKVKELEAKYETKIATLEARLSKVELERAERAVSDFEKTPNPDQ